MASIYDLLDPWRQPAVPRPESDALAALHRNLEIGRREMSDVAQTSDIHATALAVHGRRMLDGHTERSREAIAEAESLMERLRMAQATGTLAAAWTSYLRDAGERLVLTFDTLRKRGDIFLEHEAAGCPPVLVYDHEVVMDGKDLPYPCNHVLLHILPPEGVEVMPWKRPYIIIDPRAGRPAADEMVMVMNAFDTNFDADNEVYAVNTVANAYMLDPIRVTVGRLVRIYLVNLTEFDVINSLHMHAMFFDVYRTGTSLTPGDRTDTVMLCQGERAILETTFRYPGDFMFHAHQSEFAELGWMGLFRAEEAASGV